MAKCALEFAKRLSCLLFRFPLCLVSVEASRQRLELMGFLRKLPPGTSAASCL